MNLGPRAIGLAAILVSASVSLSGPADAIPVGPAAQTFTTPALATGNARFLDAAVRDLLGRASTPADADRWLHGLALTVKAEGSSVAFDRITNGNGVSGLPQLSADGRFIAFGSAASDLVPGAAGVVVEVGSSLCVDGLQDVEAGGPSGREDRCDHSGDAGDDRHHDQLVHRDGELAETLTAERLDDGPAEADADAQAQRRCTVATSRAIGSVRWLDVGGASGARGAARADRGR
jgi:hypothetical protein